MEANWSTHKCDYRFIARFKTFNVPQPENPVIQGIFNRICLDRFKSSSDDVKEILLSISEATLQFYDSIKESLPASPKKFHYIFTIRDISRVYEGLCMSNFHTRDVKPSFILRLWRNEVSSVFIDRLCTSPDIIVAENRLSSIIEDIFPSYSADCLRNPIIFGNFLTNTNEENKIYKELKNFNEVRQFFERSLERHDSQFPQRPLCLVLFHSALQYVIRLMRIFRNPRGSALLVGVGGTGKRSLTRLAANACNFNLFQISAKRKYSLSDLREDLKHLCRELVKCPTVFLISDSDLKGELVWEQFNKIISTGFPLDLFDNEEQDLLYQEAKSVGVMEDILEVLELCRNNLHFSFAMSPSGDQMRDLCRKFPCLVSSCTINWVFPWPEDALVEVASAKINLEEYNISDVTNDSVARHMSTTHILMTEAVNDFRRVTKRNFHVTPSHFLDYIQNVQYMIRSK